MTIELLLLLLLTLLFTPPPEPVVVSNPGGRCLYGGRLDIRNRECLWWDHVIVG